MTTLHLRNGVKYACANENGYLAAGVAKAAAAGSETGGAASGVSMACTIASLAAGSLRLPHAENYASLIERENVWL